MLLREDTVPLIDLLNRAEKMMIIVSAEELLQMRQQAQSEANKIQPMDNMQHVAQQFMLLLLRQ